MSSDNVHENIIASLDNTKYKHMDRSMDICIALRDRVRIRGNHSWNHCRRVVRVDNLAKVVSIDSVFVNFDISVIGSLFALPPIFSKPSHRAS